MYNRSMSVSASHLVALSDGQFKLARNLRKGDALVAYITGTRVQRVELIESIGIERVQSYAAPLTTSGTLLVNGLLCSCYATIESHRLGHWAMLPVRWWHMVQHHLRPLVEFQFPKLDNMMRIGKQRDGIHWYPEFLSSLNAYTSLVCMI